ncbi:MAG: pilus assembly PilX N-terminal domain-containing protein [Desulfobacterales bacterium]|nr:pilus assembly PilX N-terminal domain-containing protein [Desulfobacterales bacterium]
MEIQPKHMENEKGFILITSLLIMLVLTIIGIATTTNTSIELQIAGNDKIHKKTFYEAEAGAVLGTEIVEQSFNCPTGFNKNNDPENAADLSGTLVRVYERNGNLLLQDNEAPTDIGNIATADVAFPIANIASGIDVGHLYVGGETQMLPGGALQMAAGYEGKGKAAGQGGVGKIVNIYSQFNGLSNSESIILFGWRHLVGTEGGCNYD